MFTRYYETISLLIYFCLVSIFSLISASFIFLKALKSFTRITFALRILSFNSFILLDVILPGIKGREVCRKLKEDETTKDIPVIFLTAKDSPDDVKAEKEVGGEEHLTKPVTSKVLVSAVNKILNSK